MEENLRGADSAPPPPAWIGLKGCPMTVVSVDDILVTGKDDQEHLKNLDIGCRGWQMPV